MRFAPRLAGTLFLVCCVPVLAQPPVEKKQDARKPAATKFIRVKRDARDQPIALETATVRYVPASGEGNLTVDLVGVVHIGDRSYYEQLNKQLDQYDVVLYELVAKQGTTIPKGGKRDSDNPLGMIQGLMKSFLELESQTELVDYTRKNFVHADLSPEEMQEAIRKRGDTGLTLFLSIAADMLRQQNVKELDKEKKPGKQEPELDLFSLVTDPDGPIKMKRMMAQQFEDLGPEADGLGKTLNTILIADRNQAALKVFQKELTKGKKKIAIFYGAAHMPDFEKRLREDFGLKSDRVDWQMAWDLEGKKKKDR